MTGLTILASIMFLPAFVIVLAIVLRRDTRLRAQAAVEPFSLASVEYLARAVRTRAVLTVLGLAAASEIAARNGMAAAVVMVFPLFVWIAFGAIHRLVAAQRALGALGCEGASAEARYNFVDVIAHGRHTIVRTSARLVGRARARAIPSASV